MSNLTWIWHHLCVCPLIDHGQQLMKMHTEVMLYCIKVYTVTTTNMNLFLGHHYSCQWYQLHNAGGLQEVYSCFAFGTWEGKIKINTWLKNQFNLKKTTGKLLLSLNLFRGNSYCTMQTINNSKHWMAKGLYISYWIDYWTANFGYSIYVTFVISRLLVYPSTHLMLSWNISW